jgi:hypothetical protein
MSLKKNNLFAIEKLSKCDFLNKYYLKSIYFIPQLKQISFDLPLKELLPLRDKEILVHEGDENIIKIKIFIILFLIFLNDPLIKNKMNIYANEKKESSNNENLIFKSVLCKKRSMTSFLISLFIESEQPALEELTSYSNIKKLKNFQSKNFNFLANKISDFSFFFNSSLISLNLNEYKIPITFFFKNSSRKNTIHNFPYFNIISNKK